MDIGAYFEVLKYVLISATFIAVGVIAFLILYFSIFKKTRRKTLEFECPYCSHWNSLEVDKIFVEQPSSERKVKVLIPMYKLLEIVKDKTTQREKR